MSSSMAQEQQRKYVKRRSESGMKKYLIAVLLTACLLFSFGTTAFADPSGGQESDTDGASGNVTQDNEGMRVLADTVADRITPAVTSALGSDYNSY